MVYQKMDEENIEHHLYHYFSQALKLFKKRIKVLSRYSLSFFNQNPSPSLIQLSKNEYEQLTKQTHNLFFSFQQYKSLMNQVPIILARFYLRVHQFISSTNSFKLPIHKYLTQIQCLVKGSRGGDKDRLFHFMFFHLPPELRQIERTSTLYEFRTHQSVEKGEQRKEEKTDNDENYQKHLNCLQKEYKLLFGMGIEEGDLRRRFFQSREDNLRQKNRLFEEGMERNKGIANVRMNYLNKFKKYIIQVEERKKKKCKRNPKQMIKIPQILMEPQSRNLKTLSASYEYKKISRVKKESYSRKFKQRLVENDSSQSFISNKPRLKTVYFGDSVDEKETDERQKIGTYKTKKIEGQKNKIELGPLDENEDNEKVKKKIFFKKTQEYFKKRYTLFAQEKIESGMVRKEKKEKKEKNSLNNILINHSKFDI